MATTADVDDDAVDYIGVRCVVIVPNIAPIGLSKPHVAKGAIDQRRVAPHCGVVNLVRSGRKQPQRFTASAGGTARHPLLCSPYRPHALLLVGFGRSCTSDVHVASEASSRLA